MRSIRIAGMAPHFGVTSARAARCTPSPGHGPRRRRVRRRASAARQLARTAACRPPSIFSPGDDIAPDALSALLVDAGFTREDPADEHGEFALRGGILDIFPAGEAQPVRLEFIGDTIESLRTYDPATQRSIAPIDQVSIVPAEGRSTAREWISLTSPMARPTGARRSSTCWRGQRSLRIISSERDEIDAALAEVYRASSRAATTKVAADARRRRGARRSLHLVRDR